MKYGGKDRHQRRQGDTIQERVEIQTTLSLCPPLPSFFLLRAHTPPLFPLNFPKETFQVGIDLINYWSYEWTKDFKL